MRARTHRRSSAPRRGAVHPPARAGALRGLLLAPESTLAADADAAACSTSYALAAGRALSTSSAAAAAPQRGCAAAAAARRPAASAAARRRQPAAGAARRPRALPLSAAPRPRSFHENLTKRLRRSKLYNRTNFSVRQLLLFRSWRSLSRALLACLLLLRRRRSPA